MSKLRYPPLDCADVKRILRALGFEYRKNNRGSHDDWIRDDPKKGFLKVTVDCPKAPFDEFLIKSMIGQAKTNRLKFYCATKQSAKKLNKKPTKKEKLPAWQDKNKAKAAL